MLFNSLVFLVFLPIVFAVYWAIRDWRIKNFFILVASYVFYGWWDWRFLVLIVFTSGWSYIVGIVELRYWQSRQTNGSKLLLISSLVVNLGILGFFKYFNFFIDSFNAVASACMPAILVPNLASLHVVLPVGISFYTFQALSYTIDVYRRKVVPVRDPIAFFAFISFFPQLVAGPIERASNLLPQFLKPRFFDCALAVEGCRQMLWGFFKKVMVADACAQVADSILQSPKQSGVMLWIGILCFAFQIYGDFSGYSDIAIGCSKLFGIRLMRNFRCPYFSRDIAEFWRRWHISLTSWFKDYLYIPLGGSRCAKTVGIRNTFLVFSVSGLWHGANWTFVCWGLFHALCFLPLFLMGRNRKYVTDCVAQGRLLPNFEECLQLTMTFFVVLVGWTFFRAPDVGTAFCWLSRMFSDVSLAKVSMSGHGLRYVAFPLVAMLLIEWCNRFREIPRVPQCRLLRWGIYYVVVLCLIFVHPRSQTFIYFNF